MMVPFSSVLSTAISSLVQREGAEFGALFKQLSTLVGPAAHSQIDAKAYLSALLLRGDAQLNQRLIAMYLFHRCCREWGYALVAGAGSDDSLLRAVLPRFVSRDSPDGCLAEDLLRNKITSFSLFTPWTEEPLADPFATLTAGQWMHYWAESRFTPSSGIDATDRPPARRTLLVFRALQQGTDSGAMGFQLSEPTAASAAADAIHISCGLHLPQLFDPLATALAGLVEQGPVSNDLLAGGQSIVSNDLLAGGQSIVSSGLLEAAGQGSAAVSTGLGTQFTGPQSRSDVPAATESAAALSSSGSSSSAPPLASALGALLDEATRSPLPQAQQDSILSAIEASLSPLRALETAGFRPSALPSLVECNPALAAVLLERMLTQGSDAQDDRATTTSRVPHVSINSSSAGGGNGGGTFISNNNSSTGGVSGGGAFNTGPLSNAAAYFDALVNADTSLHSMEAVSRLVNVPGLPPDFIPLFVARAMADCRKITDRYMQSRLVRLVCAFLSTLTRNRVPAVAQLSLEIQVRHNRAPAVAQLSLEVQAFCIEFSRIKEATALFRQLKQAEGGAAKG